MARYVFGEDVRLASQAELLPSLQASVEMDVGCFIAARERPELQKAGNWIGWAAPGQAGPYRPLGGLRPQYTDSPSVQARPHGDGQYGIPDLELFFKEPPLPFSSFLSSSFQEITLRVAFLAPRLASGKLPPRELADLFLGCFFGRE